MKFVSLSLLIFLFAGIKGQTDQQNEKSSSLSWDEAYQKADVLVKKMTLEQKVSIMTGNGIGKGPCVGNTEAVDGIFPKICYQDGPIGVRGTSGVTAGVSGINTAASFDKEAIRQRGEYLGEEFRGKGANVYLGPDVNMVRTPYAGRNFETFGEDPYLSGVAGVETLLGVQSRGVIAQIKHLIANEQETWRNSYSANLDDKTLNEVYLWPFEEAINAGVASIMCSYNKINGTHACENEYILNNVVKKRLSFKGFITSDWLATHSTVDSANHGLDVNMPGPYHYGDRLVKAVKDGQVTEATINDKALRIISAWYKLGQDSGYPAVNMDAIRSSKDQKVDVQGNHKQYVRSLGAGSTVLLKNQNQVLPLLPGKVKSLAIIGTDAGDSMILGNKLCGTAPCLTGTVAMGGGSGSANYPYLVTPLEGIKNRAGSNVTIHHGATDIDLVGASSKAKKSDVAIVFSNVFTMEAFDRQNLKLNRNGDALIKAVARANKNTIVLIHSPSAVLMPWIDHPNIKAVVWAGYPGQESGNSLADVLFGDVNPSGRLPYTIAKNKEDYPVDISLAQRQVDYTEGVFVGYRYFDQHKIDPLFEFGFGLSYTTFAYSNLNLKSGGKDTTSSSSSYLVEASIKIENTGDKDGAEIVQAYIGFPSAAGQPPKVLRGFEKVFLKHSQSTTVNLTFGKRELSVWDSGKGNWVLTSGVYTLYIGASSRDIRQSTTFSI